MQYFTNPYNFVPFTGTCQREPLNLGPQECMTGYFECELELLTPLFIPNTSNKYALCSEEERNKKYTGYEFCSYEDLSGNTPPGKTGPKDPVIPGSEIRGAVRSVYEAAFGGCASTMRVDTVVGQEVPKKTYPGVLVREAENKCCFIPCKRATFNARRCFREGQEIWVKLEKSYHDQNGTSFFNMSVKDYQMPDGRNKPSDYYRGWIHNKKLSGKKYPYKYVFYCADEKAKELIQTEEYEVFEQIVKSCRDEAAQPGFSKSNSCIPVYYAEEKNKPRYLSPAFLERNCYQKTLEAILKENGGFQPCVSAMQICPSCKVFGMVSREAGNTGSVSTRVRFTDARLDEDMGKEDAVNYYGDYMILPEVGAPHPDTVEFYTESPYEDNEKKYWKTEGYWTYDHVRVKTDQNEYFRLLPPSLPKLRGRKFYWHHDGWKKLDKNELLDNQLKQRIRPLLPGKETGRKRTFHFRVYFDKLNRKELGQLRWSLDFMDEVCAHKIGRGKPYGLGSVRIKIRSLEIREVDGDTGTVKLVRKTYKDLGMDIATECEPVKTLKIMACAEPLRHDVSYPQVEGDEKESFIWFNNNKKNEDSKNQQPAFSKILPKPEEELDTNNSSGKRLDTKKATPKAYHRANPKRT